MSLHVHCKYSLSTFFHYYVWLFISADTATSLLFVSATLPLDLDPAAWQRNAPVDHIVPPEKATHIVKAILVVLWEVVLKVCLGSILPRKGLAHLLGVHVKKVGLAAWLGNKKVDRTVPQEKGVLITEVVLTVWWKIGLRVLPSIVDPTVVMMCLPTEVQGARVDPGPHQDVGQLVQQWIAMWRKVPIHHQLMELQNITVAYIEMHHRHTGLREKTEVHIIPSGLTAQWKTDLEVLHHSMVVRRVPILLQAQLLCSRVSTHIVLKAVNYKMATIPWNGMVLIPQQ